MFTLIKRVLGTIVGLVYTIMILVWGFTGLFPPQKKLTPERRAAAALVSKQLLDEMPRVKSRIPRLMVSPLVDDYTGEVTQQVRQTLDAEGFFNVQPATVIDRTRKNLHLEPAAVSEVELALKIARGAACDQLLWGKVNRLSQQGSNLAVDMNLALYDAATGGLLWKDQRLWESNNLARAQTAAGAPFSMAVFAASIPGMILSILASLLFVVIFALMLTPAIIKVLARESNAFNIFLLGTLSLADGAAGLLIMSRSFGGLPWLILTLLLTITAVWYNFLYCDFVEKHR